MAFFAMRGWLRIVMVLPLTASLHSDAGAISIELKDVAPDRIERQRQALVGALPLPGTPDLGRLAERLAAKGLEKGSEVFIRIFKVESELELWLRKGAKFVLLDTYPICHWSGTIGPKLAEGDKQNPEGFYKIRRRQLHLIGRWPRSLNVGFPNPYDRALGRTGSYILVHGGCSSTGCFAMTDAVMQEIYGLAEKALRAGQEYIEVHAFPFRMTEANLQRFASPELDEFWRNLKEGYDAFEATHIPPRIGVCGTRYGVQQVGPDEVATRPPQRKVRQNRFAGGRDFACPIRPVEVAAPEGDHSDLARLRKSQSEGENAEARPRPRIAERTAARPRQRRPSSAGKDPDSLHRKVFQHLW